MRGKEKSRLGVLPAAQGVMAEGSGWTGLAGCSILGDAISLFPHLPQEQVLPRTQSLPPGAQSQVGEACSGRTMFRRGSGPEPVLGPFTSLFCTTR